MLIEGFSMHADLKKDQSWVEWVAKKAWDNIETFITSVVAGVVVWFLIRWWRRRGGKDDAGPKTAMNNGVEDMSIQRHIDSKSEDASIPKAEPTKKVKEVTLVKRRSRELILPEVRIALLAGFTEGEWGKLVINIVNARFKGNYTERMREAEEYLEEYIGIGLDDLLSYAPRRPKHEEMDLTGRRDFLLALGAGRDGEPLNGIDMYKVMSRKTERGIGLGISDSLQVALLWAIKECRICLGEKSSHAASGDFLALASKYSGKIFRHKIGQSPLHELLARVDFQILRGCNYVNEYALIAHVANYLKTRCDDERLGDTLVRLIKHSKYREVADHMANCDFAGLIPDANKDEAGYIDSLRRILMARFKYLESFTGRYVDERQEIVGSAQVDAIRALQIVKKAKLPAKAYIDYIKDVAKDIGIRLDQLKGSGPKDSGNNGGGVVRNEIDNSVSASSAPDSNMMHKNRGRLPFRSVPFFLPLKRVTSS
jgi:hypothetical protein